jgi:hypothetical protein
MLRILPCHILLNKTTLLHTFLANRTMYDFCIELEENPENLALVGEILGAGGVNINGLSVMNFQGRDVIHLVVDEAGPATRVLEDAGVAIHGVCEVFVLDKDYRNITGKAGNFGAICRVLADNGVRVNFGYPAENNRFVFGVDDMEKTRELLE